MQEIPNDPIQQPLPLAYVRGEMVVDKPEDLYIPPDALEIILESFEGPLDLLLYLIRKQKFDILDLPIYQITQQYMKYVDVMQELKLELAGEYLVMAAILAEIKSRLLLPKHNLGIEEEEDPRAELVRRLQEYETIKKAAVDIDELPRLHRDLHVAKVNVPPNCKPHIILPDVDMTELMVAMQGVLQRAEAFTHHHIQREALSTRERMSKVLDLINSNDYLPFEALFDIEEGRAGVVVTFLAILELSKESLISIVQAQAYSGIHVKKREAVSE